MFWLKNQCFVCGIESLSTKLKFRREAKRIERDWCANNVSAWAFFDNFELIDKPPVATPRKHSYNISTLWFLSMKLIHYQHRAGQMSNKFLARTLIDFTAHNLLLIVPQFLFSRKPQMNNWVETWYGFYRRQSKICFQETISISSGSIFKVSLGSIQWLRSVHKADPAKIFPTRSIPHLHLHDFFANEPLELRVLLRQTRRYFLPSSFIWRHASFLRMKYSSARCTMKDADRFKHFIDFPRRISFCSLFNGISYTCTFCIRCGSRNNSHNGTLHWKLPQELFLSIFFLANLNDRELMNTW